jgi:hypothetical protein
MSNRLAALTRGIHLVVLVMASVTCDRPSARLARADTAAHPAPDTVVRRVVRVHRKASAIQRVTGALSAFRALEPLDSVLAVRVLDQRGAEMRGVRVSWSLPSAGDGAELRVINSRTDSLGVSAVNFTPGSSASPQRIQAEVTNVGRIIFDIVVPVASIGVLSPPDALWSGEGDSVIAELRDAGGTRLSGGAVTWATTDSAVVRVTASDGPRANVIGRLAGAADVVAWIEPGTVRGRTRLRVRPVLSGRIVTLDGGPVPAMDLVVRGRGEPDPVPVIDGRFAKRVAPDFPELELSANPKDDAYHAVRLRFPSPRALQDMTIVLVPTRWRIAEGSYAGQEVAIDAAMALRRHSSSAPFWRLAPLNGRAPTQIVGWPESALPLPIAFNRARIREAITAEDSVAFWRVAAQMERDLGQRLFVPATLEDGAISRDIVSVEIGSGVGEGHTFVTWNESGDAYDGLVTFRRSSTLRSAHVVTHELLHLLGFGHAMSWPTVSRPVGGTEPRLTPEDVAYAQVAMRLRRLQRQAGARPGLPVANQ